MLTDAILRRTGFRCSTEASEHGEGSEAAACAAGAPEERLLESISPDELNKKRFTLVIDLNSVLVDILDAHASDCSNMAAALRGDVTGLALPRPSDLAPLTSVQERLSLFFTFLEERLLSSKQMTVMLVLGDVPHESAPRRCCSSTHVGPEPAAQDISVSGFTGPSTALRGYPQEGLHESSYSGAPCLEGYCAWYAMYDHAFQLMQRQGEVNCSLHLTHTSGVFGAVRRLTEVKHAIVNKWAASWAKSKSSLPIPGGVPALCLCSSDPVALFLVQPQDGVMVDFYAWSCTAVGLKAWLPHGTAAATGKPTSSPLHLTHGATTASLLALHRASYLPALFGLVYASHHVRDLHEALASGAVCVDAVLDDCVELVNLYGGVVGECLVEALLSRLRAKAASGVSRGTGQTLLVTDENTAKAFLMLAHEGQLLLQSSPTVVSLVNANNARWEALAVTLPQWLGLSVFRFSFPSVAAASSPTTAVGKASDDEPASWARSADVALAHALLPRFSFETCRVPSSAIGEADELGVVVASVCCPTRTAMVYYGAAMTRAPLRQGKQSVSAWCVCGQCMEEKKSDGGITRQVRETLLPSLGSRIRPLSLCQLLYVTPVRREKVVDTKDAMLAPVPVFPSEAVLDRLRRLEAHAQVAVAALRLLRRGGVLTSHARTLLWLFHLLRVATDPNTRATIDQALAKKASLLHETRADCVYAVKEQELAAVKAALALVSAASSLCLQADATPQLPLCGIIVPRDLEAALRFHHHLALHPTDTSRMPQDPVDVQPDDVVMHALDDAYEVLKAETNAWVACKTFLQEEEGANSHTC